MKQSTETKTVRILLADDHEVVRRGAREILNAHRCIQVVGEAADGREAVDLATKLRPNVAVVDIQMPRLDGLAATRRIRETVPETQVLMFTIHESHETVRQVWKAGARGLVLKSDLAERLVGGIKAVHRGENWFTPKVLEIVMNGIPDQSNSQSEANLRPHEVETLRLLANGKANKEVASILGITVKTAESYRARIMSNLGFHSLADLTRYAIRNHLIEA